jgi:hypothetical protein
MKKNRETDWSHSDGDAPWNPNYRPTFDDYMQEYPTPGWPPKSYPDVPMPRVNRPPTETDLVGDLLASLMDARSAKANREYEPDERIRGQFK